MTHLNEPKFSLFCKNFCCKEDGEYIYFSGDSKEGILMGLTMKPSADFGEEMINCQCVNCPWGKDR